MVPYTRLIQKHSSKVFFYLFSVIVIRGCPSCWTWSLRGCVEIVSVSIYPSWMWSLRTQWMCCPCELVQVLRDLGCVSITRALGETKLCA